MEKIQKKIKMKKWMKWNFNKKFKNPIVKNSRISVSAEVYGKFNKLEDFQPKIIKKK